MGRRTTLDFSGAGDLWHITSSYWNSSSHSWWCANEATGDYDFGLIENSLISPEISLMNTPATLEFWEWYDTEPWFDLCGVDITINGGSSWIPLRSDVYGDSGGWSYVSCDLPLLLEVTYR